MWKDPEKTLISFSLFGGGRIEFGYAVYAGGMSVGTNPLMARITVSPGWGIFPNLWFKISKEYGLVKLKTIFKEDQQNFIPDWLRADCYEAAYYQLISEIENDKAGKSSTF
ncbi:hypothetical protein EBU71_11405 [bacterium]|jgi:hypothetical protein|nr:hypothetical protein [Candidatus Elulimicrobium humile]